MARQETIARRRREALAREERGRRLLQLALRGIRTSSRGLTIGCWVKPGGGVAGCVFQHAYWQGVAEGAFDTTERGSREIKDLVPERDFHLVMEAIRALDVRQHGLRRTLDEPAWRNTVEQLLVDALATHAPEPDRMPVPRFV